jgi:RNA polymerase sigma factor (sigma-70 family)
MNNRDRDIYNMYCDLFTTHYMNLTSFAYSRVLSWADAQDIVQDVFLGVWSRRERLYEGNLRSYVYKAVIDRVRQVHITGKYRAAKHSKYEDFVMYQPAEYNTHAKEVRELLAKAIECLPPSQQRVVILYYLKGEKQKDIAIKLGYSYQVVKTYASNGVKRMREEIQQMR